MEDLDRKTVMPSLGYPSCQGTIETLPPGSNLNTLLGKRKSCSSQMDIAGMEREAAISASPE